MANDDKRNLDKSERTRAEQRDEVERTGRAPPPGSRQQQADTGRGAGDRHVQQGGDRRSQQIDENQSQSDRNPREGGNRQQQQGGDKPRQMGDARGPSDRPGKQQGRDTSRDKQQR